MRLTNQFSIMGRRHDLAYGQASIWKRKLKNDRYELIENAIDKLGQLEDILENHKIETLEELDDLLLYAKKLKDIEKELGIDLITLLEVLRGKRTFFEKNRDGVIYENSVDEDDIYEFCQDYGKTWALTKEELL